MSELESLGGTGLEAAEVLVDILTDRFEGFKVRRVFHGMNTDAFGRTVIHGGEDGDLAVVERDGRRGIDAPHLVGTIVGDRPVMRRLRDGSGLALGRRQLGLPHQTQYPGLGGSDTGRPQARPELPVASPGKRRRGDLLSDPCGQFLIGERHSRPALARLDRMVLSLPVRIIRGPGHAPGPARHGPDRTTFRWRATGSGSFVRPPL